MMARAQLREYFVKSDGLNLEFRWNKRRKNNAAIKSTQLANWPVRPGEVAIHLDRSRKKLTVRAME